MHNSIKARLEKTPAPEQKALHDLPAPLSSLIGREDELVKLCAMLARPEVRLLTLSGPGGVGKTRLGIEIARRMHASFTDGISFIELAHVRKPIQVFPTIAHTLSIPEIETHNPLQLVTAFLQERHMLLLIDNLEQVVEAARDLTVLLAACPGLKIIVTSRVSLHIEGEWQFQISPLALPPFDQLPAYTRLPDYAAIALFLQRVQVQLPDFQLTQTNAPTIAAICAHLDGLPLAIELAAARARLLPPQALLARLTQRLPLLTGGAHTLPERQQTLRRTLQWSYDLLAEREQQLFRRISIFVGGCSLTAIESLYTLLSDDKESVLDSATLLINNSLLQQTEGDGSEPHLTMLGTIREYGLACLASSEEAESVHCMHATYYLTLAEQIAPELEGPQQVRWMEQLDREYENLLAALQWAVAEKPETDAQKRQEIALRLAVALRRFWLVRGYLSEGQYFLERALAMNEQLATSLYGRAQLALSMLLSAQSHYNRVEMLCTACLELFRTLKDERSIASVLYQLGRIAWMKGDLQRAQALAEEALIHSRKSGHEGSIAWSLFRLARLIIEKGEYSRGQAMLEESLALHKKLGNKRAIASSLYQLSWLHLITRTDTGKAHILLDQAQTLFTELGDKEGIAFSCYLNGHLVFIEESDSSAASDHLQRSEKLFREMQHMEGLAWTLALRGKIATTQADYKAAYAFFQEALDISLALNEKGLLASCIECFAAMLVSMAVHNRHNKSAEIEYATDQPLSGNASPINLRWAVQLWGTAEALRDTTGFPIMPLNHDWYQDMCATARQQLGDEPFNKEWARGRTASPEQLLHAPLQAASPNKTATKPAQTPVLDSLTARELEVLQLLAQGLTNPQIAERLVLSTLTVNTHVRSIYSKLGVTSRSAATGYAIKHKLT